MMNTSCGTHLVRPCEVPCGDSPSSLEVLDSSEPRCSKCGFAEAWLLGDAAAALGARAGVVVESFRPGPVDSARSANCVLAALRRPPISWASTCTQSTSLFSMWYCDSVYDDAVSSRER